MFRFWTRKETESGCFSPSDEQLARRMRSGRGIRLRRRRGGNILFAAGSRILAGSRRYLEGACLARIFGLPTFRIIAAARYGPKAQKAVRNAIWNYKRGNLRSGKRGKGGKVKNPKQAIAIGLSEAQKKGYKAPPPKKSKL